MRISRILITNTLCAGIGVMLAINLQICWEHRADLHAIWMEGTRWLALLPSLRS